MPVFQADGHSPLDACIRRALQAERYPTPAQRGDAWDAIRAGVARQAMLPPAEATARAWPVRAWYRLRMMSAAIWSSRAVLLEEAAFRRARREETARYNAYLRGPYVQFQPMW